MSRDNSNTPDKRLMRIESRLTNLGRYLGMDLTQKPGPNSVEQPVFVEDGVVYCSPLASIGDMTSAVLRYKHWLPEDTEVPVVINRRTVATIDPHEMRAPTENDDGEDHSEG